MLHRLALAFAIVAALAPGLQGARLTRSSASRTEDGAAIGGALAQEVARESIQVWTRDPVFFVMSIVGLLGSVIVVCCFAGTFGQSTPVGGVLPGYFVDEEQRSSHSQATSSVRRSVLIKQAMQAEAKVGEPQSSEDEAEMKVSARVSFKGEHEVVKVPSTKGETPRGPAHGHWVPEEILSSRHSFQDADAARLGGRTVTVAGVDCILVEPQGVVIRSAEYVSTGLVVAFHGEQMSDRVVEEWDKVLREGKILDSAMSFLLPNVTEDSGIGLESLQALVKESLELTSSSSCVLIGKGWGGHRVAELASSPEMADAVAGVVVAAPGGEPPASVVPTQTSGGLLVPCLLLWSSADRVLPYGGRSSSSWNDALSSANVPVVWKVLRGGGHDLDGMLRQGMGRVGLDLLSFLKICMLLHWLYQDASTQESPIVRTRTVSSESTATIADHFPLKMQRLLEELPAYIAEKLGGAKGEDAADTIEMCLRNEGFEATRTRLVTVLEAWVRSGLNGYF